MRIKLKIKIIESVVFCTSILLPFFLIGQDLPYKSALKQAHRHNLKPHKLQHVPNSKNVIFVTWTNLRYKQKTIMLQEHLWVVMAKEMHDLCKKLSQKQLSKNIFNALGMPMPADEKQYHFLVLKVSDIQSHIKSNLYATPGILRPCFSSYNIHTTSCSYKINPTNSNYNLWLEHLEQTVVDFPWTGLGYTFNMVTGPSKYGLSEYIITKNTKVEILATMQAKKFCHMPANKIIESNFY